MRAFPHVRALGVPVFFDVTHTLQLPGARRRRHGRAGGSSSSRWRAPPSPVGVDGVFLEVHDDPARARSDADNALRLDLLPRLLQRLLRVHAAVGA